MNKEDRQLTDLLHRVHQVFYDATGIEISPIIAKALEDIQRLYLKREKKARLEDRIEGLDYAICAFEGEKLKDYRIILEYCKSYLRIGEAELRRLKELKDS